MYKKVKLNYMKLVLPLTAALLALALALMLISGFGIRYGFMTSLPVEEFTVEELSGACAQIRTNQIEGTFARKGHEVEEGEEIDIIERFCMVRLEDDSFIGVHISDSDDLRAVQQLSAAVEQFGIDEAMAMDFGVMRGTVNEMSDELYAIFCSWGDEYATAELSGKTYGEVIRPLMLDVNYYGSLHQSISITLTVAAAVLLVLAVALLASSFTGVWDKPVRNEMKKAGKKQLEEEFAAAENFSGKLYLGKKHIWCFQKLFTDIFSTDDVIWAYARSRRLEGGKLSWYMVMKTRDKREYSVCLNTADNVQKAEKSLEKLVKPLCTGFDKEKQKLYDKDISTFCARVKNGSI